MPARASVEISANVTAAPNSSVIGLSGMASAVTDVLAIRLTPSGALSSVVNNGESPRVTTCAAWVSTHSKKIWSCLLSAIMRPLGSRQKWLKITTANTA